MGVTRNRTTPAGAVTPICNDCGVSLCWDISEQEYDEARPFWDLWHCRECNGGKPLSRQAWRCEEVHA